MDEQARVGRFRDSKTPDASESWRIAIANPPYGFKRVKFAVYRRL